MSALDQIAVLLHVDPSAMKIAEPGRRPSFWHSTASAPQLVLNTARAGTAGPPGTITKVEVTTWTKGEEIDPKMFKIELSV